MNHNITIYSVLFLVNAVISFFVAFLSWQHRSVKGAKELMKLMIAAGVWSFFVIFETSSTVASDKIFWSKMAYFGAVSTPVFYLFFVLSFVGYNRFLTIKNQVLLFIIPFITLLLTFTNESHHFIWSGFSVISKEHNMMEFYHGPAFWIGYSGYNYLVFLIATILLYKYIAQNNKSTAIKGVIILVGGLFPWIASIFYLTGINFLPGLDLVPGSIILSGTLFAYAILNIRFLDLTPMARETLVENLTDGIIALDSQNRIQDINFVAIEFLGIQAKNTIGLSLLSLETPHKELINSIISREQYGITEFADGNRRNYFSIIKKEIRNYPGSRLIILRDTTEQKMVQEELEKSERKYRELTELLPEMICEVNLEGKLLYANQFALTKFGYSNEELLAGEINIFELFTPDDLSRVHSNIEKVLKNKGNRANEYNVIKKDGEVFPVIVYSSPIYKDDSVIGLRGVMVDITDRKRHELQIAHNLKQQEILSQISLNYNSTIDFEEKTRNALKIIGQHTQVSRVYIFEDTPDGLFTNNTYEWCNYNIIPQIDELQNIPYSMIPSWKEFLLNEGIVYSENISELPQDIRDILEPQQILSIIVLPLLLDGKFFGFIGFDECSSYRKWTKSEIELLRTISNLISNAYLRNKINNELINSLNEISGIINSIPDSIIRIADDGRIISYDSQTHQGIFSNFKVRENEYLHGILNDDLANSFTTAIKECLIDGKFKFDFNYLTREEIEYFEARFIKLKEDEVLAIIRNVTESKEQERQLQIAKLKAEEASRVKSEFLANVSHEIRTPMNAILGFSEWLFDNTKDQLHKSYLHTILSSGKNLLALINDILDLSRIESGNMTIQMEPMQCSIVIEEIKQVLKQKLDAKNLAFDVNIDKSVPGYVFMDEVRFYQILFNIISNAVKFTEKGYIHVMVYATESLVENAIDLTISIEDTGIGINEDQQEVIFNAFTQQSTQSNRYYEGTGLGLSIVSGLLKKLNGEIKLKSKPGKGSTFTMKFKEVRVAETSEQTTSISEVHQNLVLKSCRILIVDDVKFNIQVLKRIINSENVTYLEASDGQEALDLLMSETPDIIFMDIRMPGLNGYAVTEIIKNNDRLARIPVVAFTASTMSDDMDAIDNLFDAFLQKPVFKKDIMAVLSRFLPQNIEVEKTEKRIEERTIINTGCKAVLPEVLATLENRFLKDWERIKGDLIIFDIEDFHKSLAEFGEENDCPIIKQYCYELNISLLSFDVEEIKVKLNLFPSVISKLKNHLPGN
ncbi:MAG: PAS domain S-box protein [Prolixibacteraceae bacterium]|nr:PAS domain S-box protein [Prolixibacteraceae bacterium]